MWPVVFVGHGCGIPFFLPHCPGELASTVRPTAEFLCKNTQVTIIDVLLAVMDLCARNGGNLAVRSRFRCGIRDIITATPRGSLMLSESRAVNFRDALSLAVRCCVGSMSLGDAVLQNKSMACG